jgi:dipeptidyl-peptidase-4
MAPILLPKPTHAKVYPSHPSHSSRPSRPFRPFSPFRPFIFLLFTVTLTLTTITLLRAAEPRIYKDHVNPHWSADGNRFWYRNDLADDAREFILVDAVSGKRQPAFDHDSVAKQINAGAKKLPVNELKFTDDNKHLILVGSDKSWSLDLDSGKVTEAPNAKGESEGLRAELSVKPSSRTGPETKIAFQNRRAAPVEMFWIDPDGKEQSYGVLEPGARREIQTFSGHVWLVKENGRNLAVFEAKDTAETALIDAGLPDRSNQNAQGQGRGGRRGGGGGGSGGGGAGRFNAPSDTSPDGKWTVRVKENNLFIKPKSGGDETQLTTDGKDGFGYGRFSWSPDSKTLVAFRIERAERKEVYLISSTPPGGGRAKLLTRGYTLPGDKFTTYELNIFDVDSKKQLKPELDRFEHEYEQPRIHWSKDSAHFGYHQEDRGHQRFRVLRVDAHTGAIKNLVDERSKTFIWTAHLEGFDGDLVNWMNQSDEVIYVSENSGWRHLYLVDPEKGLEPMTAGEWIVRGLEKIDEDKRQVWFRASGVFPEQDPYLIQYGRVNFDGSGLVWLTAENGNHSIQYSPDRRFIIDTFSRVDSAPGSELRRVEDGKLICKLEDSETSALASGGWEAPEVFVAKGRDGKTDIWGLIVRPRDLDPKKKYPILEDIYAGPHGSFVPKTFSTRGRYDSWNKLGFIVVKIDGMGTANRSKAFQDVSWHNLKDSGFEDRILWMKAAAKKYPYLDLDRVGVYGTSSGGQSAAAAVLFHPEFYKAAIANCGCHDNRMDKASWNEQWMGYPVGPQYAECSNIDNAGKLGGALFVIVGELDTNVPPESTYRFVDALIKARKDFDFLVVPGADHGARGPASPYIQRRMQDFFLKHLTNEKVPDRNTIGG